MRVRANRSPALALAALVALAALGTYAGALENGFVYDDHFLLERNRLVTASDFAGAWTTHYWGGYEGNETGQYRPLTVTTYVLDGLGGLQPSRFHATNLLLHAANSVLAFLLCLVSGLGPPGAAAAGLLFAVHPLHAEAAAGITFGRPDLMAALFVLGGLLCYIQGDRKGEARFYPLALAAFLGGMLSKESALALPGLVALYDVSVFAAGSNALWRAVRRAVSARWIRWAGFAAVFAGCLVIRQAAAGLGFSAGSLEELNNPLVGESVLTRILTASTLFVRYLGMAVWPATLSVDYSLGTLPLARSLTPGALAALGTVALCLAGWFVALARSPRLFFLAGLFLVPYVPVSQTLVLINAMFQERFLYLPAMGIFAVVGFGVDRAYRSRRSAVVAVGTAVLLLFALRAASRVRDWRDDLSLFESAVAAYPRGAKMHHTLADALVEAGRKGEAAAAYRRALSIREDALTYNNLGNLLASTGDADGAARAYTRAVSLRPDYAEAWMNRGLAALQHGDAGSAEAAFTEAVRLRPSDPEAHYNLGVARTATGRPRAAAEAYETALALDAQRPRAWYNLANAYRDDGRQADATMAYRRFLSLWPSDDGPARAARREIAALDAEGGGGEASP